MAWELKKITDNEAESIKKCSLMEFTWIFYFLTNGFGHMFHKYKGEYVA